MIVSKVLMLPRNMPSLIHARISDPPDYVVDCLNEIRDENVRHLVGIPSGSGLMGYVVFYENENVCTCPGCGHDLSNTFTFCPNCGRRLK